jgi:hypothetical protein
MGGDLARRRQHSDPKVRSAVANETTIHASIIEDIHMRHTRSLLLRYAGATAALVMALVGCTERPREATRAGSLTAPTTVLRSSTGALLVLACPVMPAISKRAVPAGSAGDMNGNGVVCDQRVGTPGRERTLTMDDVLMPATAVRR